MIISLIKLLRRQTYIPNNYKLSAAQSKMFLICVVFKAFKENVTLRAFQMMYVLNIYFSNKLVKQFLKF